MSVKPVTTPGMAKMQGGDKCARAVLHQAAVGSVINSTNAVKGDTSPPTNYDAKLEKKCAFK